MSTIEETFARLKEAPPVIDHYGTKRWYKHGNFTEKTTSQLRFGQMERRPGTKTESGTETTPTSRLLFYQMEQSVGTKTGYLSNEHN